MKKGGIYQSAENKIFSKHNHNLYFIILDIQSENVYYFYLLMQKEFISNSEINLRLTKERNLNSLNLVNFGYCNRHVFEESIDGYLGQMNEKNRDYLWKEFKKTAIHNYVYEEI